MPMSMTKGPVDGTMTMEPESSGPIWPLSGLSFSLGNGNGKRIWGGVDYLMWWVKDGPNPVPLVTVNNGSALGGPLNTIGAIGEPGTIIAFGGRGIDFGTANGLRLTLGTWLDDDGCVGVEVSGFALERRNVLFNTSSVGGNFPTVAIPFNATDPFGPGGQVGETSLNNGGAPSTIVANSSMNLYGFELNGIAKAWCSDRLRANVLVGFRFMELAETLNLTDSFYDNAIVGTAGTLQVQDGFSTHNDFYGVQFGGKVGYEGENVAADVGFKLGFGDMNERLDIFGSTTVTNGAFGLPTGRTVGGVFAQGSNIGSYNRDRFAVVPEFNFDVAWKITPNVRAKFGYDILYLSDVMRPGEQINRNVNINQNNVISPVGGAAGVGSPQPFASLHSTDFFAHGINFGFEFRW
jgi:hypothetical protein